MTHYHNLMPILSVTDPTMSFELTLSGGVYRHRRPTASAHSDIDNFMFRTVPVQEKEPCAELLILEIPDSEPLNDDCFPSHVSHTHTSTGRAGGTQRESDASTRRRRDELTTAPTPNRHPQTTLTARPTQAPWGSLRASHWAAGIDQGAPPGDAATGGYCACAS